MNTKPGMIVKYNNIIVYAEKVGRKRSLFDMRLGERLRAERLRCEFTTRAVAALLGCSRSIITDYERGTRRVADDALTALSDLYGFSIPWLLEGLDA